MTLSRLSFAFFALASLAIASGCQRQAQGERCALTNADSDCEDGLVCTEAGTLRGGDEVDRCCPPANETPSDSRCELDTTATDGGDGDGTGEGGAGGMSSGEGTGGLGADCLLNGECEACRWDSDCVEPLVCGPSGECQPECNTNRDCSDGEICSSEQTCEAE